MDAIDQRIVALLRENARRSFKDIGEAVHLTAPAVKRRVDRLERDGVILGYSAVVIRAPRVASEAFVYLFARPHARGGEQAAVWASGLVSPHTVRGRPARCGT